ncbi:MAG: hypothetical protein NTU99_12230 [Pseudanabaena sp. LacPavin_0818_WC45_MAG_42_6]|nr:hypothetical protein [Pseudanabaena sp. LacPavin_0818_WC45_MAG_42_6]
MRFRMADRRIVNHVLLVLSIGAIAPLAIAKQTVAEEKITILITFY